MNDYIRMEHITKRFPGVTANADVSIGFAKGEIHALLGENGAGKSTLMNMLYGLLKPDEGQITMDGKPVRIGGPQDAIVHGNRLIMMYEGRIVIDVSGEEKKNLTVPQLLELFSKVSGSDEADDKLLLS